MAVRLEGSEAGGRLRQILLAVVAGFAGLHAVGRIDLGARIVHLGDLVAAVAVKALGRVGIAQLVDLTVVGLDIAFEVFLVTAAAIAGDGELGSVSRGIADVVAGVAIDTNRCLRVVLAHGFLAMDRFAVVAQLVFVAGIAAQGRRLQAPGVALRRAFGRHRKCVGVVALVAARVRMRLVFLVRPRMEGTAVGQCIFSDLFQARGQGFALGFELARQLFVAGRAFKDFGSAGLGMVGRGVGDVLVAGHALHLGVHRFRIVVGVYRIELGRAVRPRHFDGGGLGVVTAQAFGAAQIVRSRAGRHQGEQGKQGDQASCDSRSGNSSYFHSCDGMFAELAPDLKQATDSADQRCRRIVSRIA